MRILQVLAEPFDLGHRQEHVLYLSKGLEQLGHEVRVFARHGSMVPVLEKGEVEFQLAKHEGAWAMARELRICTKVWRPDILHAHSASATQVCLTLAAPVVTTYHGEASQPYQARSLVRAALPRVIAVSEYHRSMLLQGGSFAPDQLSVVPEGLDFEAYAESASRLRTKQRPPGQSSVITLLHAARVDKPEQLHHVLEASRTVAGHGLSHRLLLWNIPDERSELETQIGLINHELGYPLIQICDGAYEFPALLSHVDGVLGTGRTVLQALACHKPVICLQVGELGGFVTSRNVYAIEENRFEGEGNRPAEDLIPEMASLIKRHRALYPHMEEARELARQIADLRSIARRTLAVYSASLDEWKLSRWIRRMGRRWRLLIR